MGKTACALLAGALLLLGSAESVYAWGHAGFGFHRPGFAFHHPGFFPHDRFRFHHRGFFRHRRDVFLGARVFLGPPFWWGPPDWPVYSPPVIIQSPPVYIQNSAPTGTWYYCPDPAGYYPDVKECPSGWMTVVPQPQ